MEVRTPVRSMWSSYPTEGKCCSDSLNTMQLQLGQLQFTPLAVRCSLLIRMAAALLLFMPDKPSLFTRISEIDFEGSITEVGMATFLIVLITQRAHTL